MSTYKVSYVVKGSDHPGGIINLEYCPQIGDKIRFGSILLEVLEVEELMPPRIGFFYLHTTCRLVDEGQKAEG